MRRQLGDKTPFPFVSVNRNGESLMNRMMSQVGWYLQIRLFEKALNFRFWDSELIGLEVENNQPINSIINHCVYEILGRGGNPIVLSNVAYRRHCANLNITGDVDLVISHLLPRGIIIVDRSIFGRLNIQGTEESPNLNLRIPDEVEGTEVEIVISMNSTFHGQENREVFFLKFAN